MVINLSYNLKANDYNLNIGSELLFFKYTSEKCNYHLVHLLLASRGGGCGWFERDNVIIAMGGLIKQKLYKDTHYTY